MTNKAEIMKNMAQESGTGCEHTAHDYLVALVDAGMEFPNAEARVLGHFVGVSQAKLIDLYDA